jgi:hypothetical protein
VAAGLAVAFIVLFVLSHVIAHVIGAWPSVIVVSLGMAALAWLFADAPARGRANPTKAQPAPVVSPPCP